MSQLKTFTINATSNVSSAGRKENTCRALICDPDRYEVTDESLDVDEFGNMQLLNKFVIDKAVYEAVIRQYEARRLLLQRGVNYTARELCRMEGSGYFSASEWEEIAHVCLQHHAKVAGVGLAEYYCSKCEAHHGFHIA